jgi:prevent-host-death family protein
MKTVTVRDLQKQIRGCLDAAQTHHVVITRHGKPAAILIGVEGQDWETVIRATDATFWQLIQERRQQPTLSLEELKAQLREQR